MKICSKKDIKVLTGVMAASLLLGGCTGRTPSSKPLKNDPSVKAAIDFSEVKKTGYDKDLMDAEYKRYCFDLLSQTIRDYGGEGNVMISPASIMMESRPMSAIILSTCLEPGAIARDTSGCTVLPLRM